MIAPGVALGSGQQLSTLAGVSLDACAEACWDNSDCAWLDYCNPEVSRRVSRHCRRGHVEMSRALPSHLAGCSEPHCRTRPAACRKAAPMTSQRAPCLSRAALWSQRSLRAGLRAARQVGCTGSQQGGRLWRSLVCPQHAASWCVGSLCLTRSLGLRRCLYDHKPYCKSWCYLRFPSPYHLQACQHAPPPSVSSSWPAPQHPPTRCSTTSHQPMAPA